MFPLITLMPTRNGLNYLSLPLYNLLTIYRNDILRKHGIIPEKPPSPTPIIEEALLEAAQREHENRLENKTLDELDALEDEEEAEFLAKYRFANPHAHRKCFDPDIEIDRHIGVTPTSIVAKG